MREKFFLLGEAPAIELLREHVCIAIHVLALELQSLNSSTDPCRSEAHAAAWQMSLQTTTRLRACSACVHDVRALCATHP
eukprot:2881134-Prymnesium_polylepis.1